MNDSPTSSTPTRRDTPSEILATANRINELLKLYSDKDWNYSRITLKTISLRNLESPYGLWIDFMETKTKRGHDDFAVYSRELSWGSRHSDELGILELVSFRLNRALVEVSNDELWSFRRPVIRLVKKEELTQQGITDALWYHVEEVAGEEFDNR